MQIIQRKLLGLKVVITYEDDDGEVEAEGVIEAAWQVDDEIWVAVVPYEGYVITGPLHHCFIERDDSEDEEAEALPELSVDGVGPSSGEGWRQP